MNTQKSRIHKNPEKDPSNSSYIDSNKHSSSTYDHRIRRIWHPVRSAEIKPYIGGLVVGWVTTSEYPLLYVFFANFLCFFWVSQYSAKGRWLHFSSINVLDHVTASHGRFWPISFQFPSSSKIARVSMDSQGRVKEIRLSC